MLLRSLVLNNIRSYDDATIDFPEGSILLSGDVGSGKTTILLAIEFALFGLFRGELAASSLLRHGEHQGAVTLSCVIDGKDVTITRTLKREKNGVKQGNGKIVIDGDEQSCTPVELKAKALELLGYPHELLTKAKSLIFRYTVYTPQEEMKRILFDDPDARLETLRKLFNIDHYRRARDNAAALAKELRVEERALGLQLEELPHKRKALEEAKKAAKTLAKDAEDAKRRAVALDKEREVEEASLRKLQDRHAALQRAAQRVEGLDKTLADLRSRKEHLQKTRERGVKDRDKLKEERIDVPEDAGAQLERKEAAQRAVEERMGGAREKLARIAAQREDVQRNKDDLSALAASCPLCRQDVPHEHRAGLLKQQEAREATLAKERATLTGFLEAAEDKLAGAKEAIARLRKQQLARAQALERRRGKERELALIEQQLAAAIRELDTIEKDEVRTAKELSHERAAHRELLPDKERYEAQQEKTVAAQRAAREAQTRLAQHEARLEAARKEAGRVEEELSRLGKHQARTERLQAALHWLKEAFAPATTAMEQAVFGALHGEFDQLFSAWFSTIIEDEALQVRLDRSFTPIIVLNGYETEAAALSGGEKTAVALAYRLALNQVINEYITTIQTRDLLILDEPTDGFSTHQLDRMRDVLDQLRLEQLILVSHEAKMEGFVEHVIRVTKQEQTSRIA